MTLSLQPGSKTSVDAQLDVELFMRGVKIIWPATSPAISRRLLLPVAWFLLWQWEMSHAFAAAADQRITVASCEFLCHRRVGCMFDEEISQ